MRSLQSLYQYFCLRSNNLSQINLKTLEKEFVLIHLYSSVWLLLAAKWRPAASRRHLLGIHFAIVIHFFSPGCFLGHYSKIIEILLIKTVFDIEMHFFCHQWFCMLFESNFPIDDRDCKSCTTMMHKSFQQTISWFMSEMNFKDKESYRVVLQTF